MIRCRIADLNVKIDGHSKEFSQAAESYAFDFRCRADIEVNAGREALLQYRKEHPALSAETCADLVAGTEFYRGLLSFGGFMLRAAAVSYHEKAYLFSHRFSTHNLLYADSAKKILGEEAVCLLSAERTAIRFTEEQFCYFKTPWGGRGDENCAPKLPVGAVVFAEPSEEPFVRKIRQGEYLQLFFPQTVRPAKIEQNVALLGMFIKMTEQIPVYVIGTGKKAVAVENAVRDFFAEIGIMPTDPMPIGTGSGE